VDIVGDCTPLVAAIDGGGSRTTAAVARVDGTVLGVGSGGPANFLSTNKTVARESVRAALAAARAASGLDGQRLASAAICVAGVGLVQSAAALKYVISAVSAGTVVAASDTDAAWTAAFPFGGAGVIVIAGTGSIVVARNADGAGCEVGGWGYLVADEGSGYWIARAGLAAATRAFDGRDRQTLLSSTLLECLGIRSMGELREALYVRGLDRRGIADLAPAVFEAADSGDPAAQRIVRYAADELVLAVSAAVARLGANAPVPVARFGSLWRSGRLSELFEKRLSRANPGLPVVEAPMPALGGAVLLAIRATGRQADEQSIRQVIRTLGSVPSGG
jgi:N-acetylglucosamine kinase-like BadF-type ATPase